jgi:hypothetical protein
VTRQGTRRFPGTDGTGAAVLASDALERRTVCTGKEVIR